MALDPFLSTLFVIGLIGFAAGVQGALRRSPALLVTAGFLVLGATSFALTAIVLA